MPSVHNFSLPPTPKPEHPPSESELLRFPEMVNPDLVSVGVVFNERDGTTRPEALTDELARRAQIISSAVSEQRRRWLNNQSRAA